VGAGTTQLSGINDQGDLAGIYVNADQSMGFWEIENSGPIFISVPGSFETLISGINDLDETWGSYVVAAGNGSVQHGFIREADGTITTLDGVTGINDVGFLVGSFGYGTLGNFTQISIPGGTVDSTGGVNDADEFVGTYSDSSGTHGFIASFATPEPSTGFLAVGGLLGIVALKRRSA
jgi:hypothetical protein